MTRFGPTGVANAGSEDPDSPIVDLGSDDENGGIPDMKLTTDLVGQLLKSIGSQRLDDSVQSRIIMKAFKKKLYHHPNLKNKDVVRSKWSRLLASRSYLYQYWDEVVESGRHKELLRLDLSLLEKEATSLKVESLFSTKAYTNAFESKPAKNTPPPTFSG